jgi:hypothetical protein
LLHLGIPTLGLVPEIDTGFQQFLYANTKHSFPLVGARGLLPANHPAEHGIVFDVIVATDLHSKAKFRPFNPCRTNRHCKRAG